MAVRASVLLELAAPRAGARLGLLQPAWPGEVLVFFSWKKACFGENRTLLGSSQGSAAPLRKRFWGGLVSTQLWFVLRAEAKPGGSTMLFPLDPRAGTPVGTGLLVWETGRHWFVGLGHQQALVFGLGTGPSAWFGVSGYTYCPHPMDLDPPHHHPTSPLPPGQPLLVFSQSLPPPQGDQHHPRALPSSSSHPPGIPTARCRCLWGGGGGGVAKPHIRHPGTPASRRLSGTAGARFRAGKEQQQGKRWENEIRGQNWGWICAAHHKRSTHLQLSPLGSSWPHPTQPQPVCLSWVSSCSPNPFLHGRS